MTVYGIRTTCLLGLICLMLSCGTENKPARADSAEYEKSTPATDSPSHTISLPRSFTREDAETIVAKHYSSLNQQEGFVRYKGLGIAIGSIKQQATDTFSVNAKVTGRRVSDKAKDTTSIPFINEHSFKAYFSGNAWSAQFNDK